ncbi:MAG: hypothetical protein EWM47_11130 [Anaerolineaceae bacterium]|nr:MAG: hypothetical protein EWM47_11130 [Anaerolineaceae bacterium]
MGEIIIEESNHRAFAMTLANFFMLVASIAILIYGFMKENKLYIIMGILASLIFFVGFVMAISQAIKEKKLLIITMDGINDCSSIGGGFGYISFGDIKEFEIIRHHNYETIGIILNNRKEFISKLTHPKWKLAKRNLYLKQPAIQIHTELAKDMEPEDILTLLQKRLRDYKRLYE